MIREIVARAQLDDALPEISSETDVAVLVPLSNDPVWAASMSWDVARSAALRGRRVVLADLSIDDPALDRGAAKLPGPEGIVDTILYGTSLAHVSVKQDTRELYYVPSGTYPPDTGEVLRSKKWIDLARGFQDDGSLLLLFTPLHILGELRLTPQAVFLLAPDLPSERDAAMVQLNRIIPETTPAIAIVDRPDARKPESRPALSPPASQGPEKRRRPRAWYAGIGVLALTAGFLVFVLTRQPAPSATAGPENAPTDTAEATPVNATPPVAETDTVAADTLSLDAAPSRGQVPPPPLTAPAPADSLLYALQVAAFKRMEPAEVVRAGLDSSGYKAYLTPVDLAGRGIWYRVMVGAYPDLESAVRLRSELRDSRRLDSGTGTVLRAPYALVLGSGLSPDSGVALLRGLRQRNVSGYILRAPDGSVSVLHGAFSAPAQARAADSILRERGLRAVLESRMGKTE